jgi:hypothetical protein
MVRLQRKNVLAVLAISWVVIEYVVFSGGIGTREPLVSGWDSGREKDAMKAHRKSETLQCFRELAVVAVFQSRPSMLFPR